MVKLRKAEYKKWSLRYLTEIVRKGPKIELKSIKVINGERSVINIKYEREEIKNSLINQNTAHYKKVLKTLVYQDKIYEQLAKDKIRDKILDGSLHCEECDNIAVCNFLKLLRINYNRADNSKLIVKDEWEQAVKRSKRLSSSSIFSKRNYSMYKCLLRSEQITKILLKYFNLILVK